MFTRRKITASPSLPKFKQQIKVSDSRDEDSTDENSAEDREDVEHFCNTMSNSTDEDNEDVGKFRNTSMFTTDEDYEDIETLRNARMFTTDEDYEDVETFLNTKFSNFDTDQLVVPSTKFLLDDNLGENLKRSHPVASSTRIFSETSRLEKTSHHECFKPVKETTFVLPKPPRFDDEKDDASDFQLGPPKACSTFMQPQANDDACDIQLGSPKARSTILPLKGKKLVFKFLSSCQSEILSSFEPVSLPPESTLASEIQDPPAKRIGSDITDATESIATNHDISPNNYFSHKNSASTSHFHGSNCNISEGSETNSFPKAQSKQRLVTYQRTVKDPHVKKAKNPIRDDVSRLKKNQHGSPKNNFDRNQKHAICCLSNAVRTSHSLKIMKPSYRKDVPIDDLCK